MEIRKTSPQDLPRVLEIYDRARRFMAESGNPTQWGTDRPSRQQIEADIQCSCSYVCLQDGRIQGVFAFLPGPDPTYGEIVGPGWISEESYDVIHRIASAGAVPGVGSFCLQWALGQRGHLRIDTHENNRPMRSLLQKLGFSYCGVIRLENGDPRLAFEKRLPTCNLPENTV